SERIGSLHHEAVPEIAADAEVCSMVDRIGGCFNQPDVSKARVNAVEEAVEQVARVTIRGVGIEQMMSRRSGIIHFRQNVAGQLALNSEKPVVHVGRAQIL